VHKECGLDSGGNDSSQLGTSRESVLSLSLGGERLASGAISGPFRAGSAAARTVGSNAPKLESSANPESLDGMNSEGRSATGSCSHSNICVGLIMAKF
jgi:hypothetical protein